MTENLKAYRRHGFLAVVDALELCLKKAVEGRKCRGSSRRGLDGFNSTTESNLYFEQ